MRSLVDTPTEEYICPVTTELTIDLVMAMDGKIYERSKIENWLNENQTNISTGAVTSTALLLSPQTCNTIESLVKSGAIDGDMATA